MILMIFPCLLPKCSPISMNSKVTKFWVFKFELFFLKDEISTSLWFKAFMTESLKKFRISYLKNRYKFYRKKRIIHFFIILKKIMYHGNIGLFSKRQKIFEKSGTRQIGLSHRMSSCIIIGQKYVLYLI